MSAAKRLRRGPYAVRRSGNFTRRISPVLQSLETRLMPATTGMLDPGFHSGSPVTVDFNYLPNPAGDPPVEKSGDDRATAVALDASGNIVAAGILDSDGPIGSTGYTQNGEGASVVRLIPDGTPDAVFGSRGPGREYIFRRGLGRGTITDVFTSIARDPSGSIAINDANPDPAKRKSYLFMAGYAGDVEQFGAGNNAFLLGKFLASDGGTTPEGTYRFTEVAGNHDTSDEANAILAQPDGTLLLAGSSVDKSTNIQHAALARVLPSDLQPDTTFGADDPDPFHAGLKLGLQWLDLGLASASIAAMAFQSDGRIVLVGTGRVNANDADQFLVARLNADDTLDTTFGPSGSSGTVLIPFDGAASASALALAIEPGTDRIIVGGSANFAGTKKDFALAALSADGKQLDPTFGSSGKVTADFLQQDDSLNGLALQPDGAIVAVGEAQSVTTIGGNPVLKHSVALARYLPNGAPDPDFGPGGSNFILYNVNGGSNDAASAVAIQQKDGKIVVAGWSDANKDVSHVDYFVARFIGQTPKLTSLDPAPATAGTPFTLTVEGTGFVQNSVVLVNGKTLTPQSITSTSLTVSISATDLPTAGQATIAVQNPGGITSRSTTLTVNPAPPVVTLAFAGSPTKGVAFQGTVATFSDADSGISPGSYQATIDWGDQTITAGVVSNSGGALHVEGSHTYSSAQVFPVVVTVKDPDNATGQASGNVTVKIPPAAPVVTFAFGGSPTKGVAFQGTVATFTDADSGASPGSYQATIDWGDQTITAGVVSNSGGVLHVEGTHTYSSAQVFPVIVTVKDPDNATGSANGNVTVVMPAQPMPPVVTFAFGGSPTRGVAFQGTVATFTDADSGASPGSYQATIDWGDQTITAGVVSNSGGILHVEGTHTYTAAQVFPVIVTVKDPDNATGSANGNVTVLNVAPTVNAGNDAAIDEAAMFTGSGSFTDPDPDAWTATVNYGDGSGDQPLVLGAGKTFGLSHVYADNGSFPVTVKVADNHGGVRSDTLTVTVKNLPPTATLVAPANVDEGSQFTVSLNDPIDPSPSDVAAGFTYAFNLGAGYGAFGTASSVSIPADNDGTLTIRAKIRDKDGGESEFAAQVTVANVAPVVMAGGNVNLVAGQSLSRAGSFADPGADSWSAQVDYGDGGGFMPLSLTGKTFSLEHPYSKSGTFTVLVRVMDGDGGSDTRQFNVVVNPRPDTTPPRVVSFTTTPKQGTLGTMQVKFSEAMTIKGVASLGSYRLVSAGGDKRFGTRDDKTLTLGKVVYDPVKRVATLTAKTRVALNQPLRLIVRSAGPITDLAQNRLDGNNDGKAGGDYTGSFGTKPRR